MNTTLGDSYEQNVVSDFVREHAVSSEKVALRDFNYLTPTNKLEASLGDGTREVYDYPGGFQEHGDGDRYARLRLEEREARLQTARGTSNVRHFTAGARFELSEHYRRDANIAWQLIEVRHRGRAGSLEVGVPDEYENESLATPHATVYRPPRATPRPRVHGTQTAMVVGKGGEEIWVDRYGRVKVQFHWDRLGKKDENSSCWVRVGSTWAGKQWGFIQIPRIGQEVIVDFLEGDPDQPIVVGRVYNADSMPPYELPANQTQSGLKTRSSKGGAAANANELRFEDKKGSEQVLLHAEKALDIEVEADETHWVGHDQTMTVDHDRTKEVKNDETTKIGKNRTEDVAENETITIGKSRTETIQENESVTVADDRTVSIGKSDVLNVGKDLTISVDGSESATVARDFARQMAGNRATSISKDDNLKVQGKAERVVTGSDTEKIGGSRKAEIGGGDELKIGQSGKVESAMEFHLKAGMNVTIEAGVQLTLRCGASKIELSPAGVVIQGLPMVKIN